MTETRNTASLIDRMSAPAPVLIVGTMLWVVATILSFSLGAWTGARPICLAGIAVGVLGFGLYSVQRRAAVRGDRGAQQGAGLVD